MPNPHLRQPAIDGPQAIPVPTGDGPKKPRLINEPRMNATWFRTFLKEKKVREPDAKWDLDDKALLVLALDIFVRANYHHHPPPERPEVEAYERVTLTRECAEQALEGLEALHSASIQGLATWNELPDLDPSKLTQIERCDEHISRLAAAIAGLRGVVPHLQPVPLRRRLSQRPWTDHAVALAHHFVGHLQKCNPSHQPFGIGKRGPVVRYVREAVPLITGEEPEYGDVYTFLDPHRAEILKPDSHGVDIILSAAPLLGEVWPPQGG
jgi:hypothetical protein